MKLLGALLALTALALPNAALAQDEAAYADPRIQEARYDERAVYPLYVGTGYAAVVEFGADESVVSVVVGESSTWQVSQTEAGNRLVVKPLSGASTTNMIVVTSAHRYVFSINARDSAMAAFVLKFTYGPEASAPAAALGHYQMKGSKRLRPASLSDNGRDTTIVWAKDDVMPAVFAYDETGEETIVNGRMTPQGYVIDGVHARLVFRLGKERLVADRLTGDTP